MRTERISGGVGAEVRTVSISASEVHQERLERARMLIVVVRRRVKRGRGREEGERGVKLWGLGVEAGRARAGRRARRRGRQVGRGDVGRWEGERKGANCFVSQSVVIGWKLNYSGSVRQEDSVRIERWSSISAGNAALFASLFASTLLLFSPHEMNGRVPRHVTFFTHFSSRTRLATPHQINCPSLFNTPISPPFPRPLIPHQPQSSLQPLTPLIHIQDSPSFLFPVSQLCLSPLDNPLCLAPPRSRSAPPNAPAPPHHAPIPSSPLFPETISPTHPHLCLPPP